MEIYSERVVLPDQDGHLQIRPALLRIENGRITSVRSEQACFRDELAEGVDDVGAKLVTPTFINSHTHLSMNAMRGIGQFSRMRGNVVENLYFRIEEAMDGGDIRAFARMGAYDSLLAGVGTVWDHYYGGLELARGIDDVGLTAVVAPTLQDKAGPGTQELDSQLRATQDLACSSDFTNRGIVAALGPHATDTVSDGLWTEIGKLRDKLNLPIHAHVAQSIEEVERSFAEHGCSPVERLQRMGLLGGSQTFLLVHAIFLGKPDLDRLNPATDFLGFCPFSQAQFSFPANIFTWLDAGLQFVVGTDCGACNDTMNVQQELRLIAAMSGLASTWSAEQRQFSTTNNLEDAHALQAKRVHTYDQTAPKLSTEALLNLLWTAPSDLHPQLPIGKLEPGRLANLIVWDLEKPNTWPALAPLRTLAMTDATRSIDQVMINGKWHGERGCFAQSICQSDAYKDAQQEADARLDALLRRLSLT